MGVGIQSQITHQPPGVQHKEISYWAGQVNVSTWKNNGVDPLTYVCIPYYFSYF